MNDLTPESIEAIPPSDIIQIRDLAASLHASTPGVLELLSPKDVEQEENLRAAMKTKLDEAMSELTKQIADLDALKRDLGIAKKYQTSDKHRLESVKIGLYVKLKELRQNP